MNFNANVRVFCKAIQANGEKNDVDIINIFCFTLHNAISEWGEIFMKAHLVCWFEELKAAFCKPDQKAQMDKQVYMALWMIK